MVPPEHFALVLWCIWVNIYNFSTPSCVWVRCFSFITDHCQPFSFILGNYFKVRDSNSWQVLIRDTSISHRFFQPLVSCSQAIFRTSTEYFLLQLRINFWYNSSTYFVSVPESCGNQAVGLRLAGERFGIPKTIGMYQGSTLRLEQVGLLSVQCLMEKHRMALLIATLVWLWSILIQYFNNSHWIPYFHILDRFIKTFHEC